MVSETTGGILSWSVGSIASKKFSPVSTTLIYRRHDSFGSLSIQEPSGCSEGFSDVIETRNQPILALSPRAEVMDAYAWCQALDSM